MPDVVALALPGGTAWVDELRRAWDSGDAVAPVDLRLPPDARDDQMAALAPTMIVDRSGRRRLNDGQPSAPGDALVITSSGTSGRARAAVLTHEALLAAATATSAVLQVDPGADRWLACLPLAHVGGFGVVSRALLTTTPLEVHDGFDTAAVSAAAGAGVSLVSLVPAMLERIRAESFRHILLGGSAIPSDRPANSVATYGMTETGGGVVYDGRPLANVECRVIDGEIQLRCPMLLREYRDGTDPRQDGGWYPTGDGGTFENGLVKVDGRLDDAIITGGEKVWPELVERVLEAQPGVRGAAVVGRPDPTWGQAVTAIIEPEDASAPPALDALRDAVKETLPGWYAPKSIELVAQVPRTALGKISRVELRRP